MRLFIAIPICSEVKRYLRNLPVPGKIVVDYHITLKFLGDLPDHSDLLRPLESVGAEPFKLKLEKIGLFKSYRQRVVWVGVRPLNPVIDLHRKIECALKLPKDKRFHPHITLSRLKDQNMTKIIIEKKEIIVDSFQLIKSTLTSVGPEYTVIKTYSL